MYDLRAIKTKIKHRPNPNKPGHKGTTPYLTFGDLNYATLNDMAVCSHLGLLACGMFPPYPSYANCQPLTYYAWAATNLRTVQLFSLQTGKLLEPKSQFATYKPPFSSPSNMASKIVSHSYPDAIDCVQFETIPEPYDPYNSYIGDAGKLGAGDTSLLVASGKIIEEWKF